MKRTLLTTSLLLNAFFSFAQPTIQWQKSLGGTDKDNLNSIKPTNDGGYIIAGHTLSTNGDVTSNHGLWDYWIVKTDNSGIIQWQKSFGGTGDDQAESIKQTAEGGYIIVGYSTLNDGDVTTNNGNYDCWIIKLDNFGTIQWQKSFGGMGWDVSTDVQQTSDGGYIVAGYSDSNDGDIIFNNGNSDYWIIKLDSSGTIQWQKSFGGTNFDGASSIQETVDGGYIIAGSSESVDGDITTNNGNSDCWIVKLDNSGIIQWQKSLGGTNYDQANSIQQTADGGYIISGESNSNDGDVTGNYGNYDCWIVKLDNLGTIQWQKNLGGTASDGANFIQQTTDGGYIVVGHSESNNGNVSGNKGGRDYWIIKLDNSGTIQWQKCLGGTGWDISNAVQQTSDGGYIIAGYSASLNGDVTGNHGNYDFWIIKLSGTSVGLTEGTNENIISIYPNPSSGTFTLESTEEGFYSIVNELGQTIQEIKLNNTNNYTVNISNLNTGIYFIVGYTKDKMIRQKMMITK